MLIRSSENREQEVIFEGTIKGEGLSIFLSENDPTSTVRWIVRVYVHVAQGWFLLGFFTTNTAVVDGAAARVVGFASCPGVKGWKVSFQCRDTTTTGNSGFDTEAFIQAGLCCGGGSPYGVFVPPPPGTGGVPVDVIGGL